MTKVINNINELNNFMRHLSINQLMNGQDELKLIFDSMTKIDEKKKSKKARSRENRRKQNQTLRNCCL